MKFEIGHDLSIQGNRYLVLGSITYEDRLQGDGWEEYRLRNHQNKTESWLSYDEGNAEYEMSFMVKTSSPPEGFSLVDSGTQVVRSRAGNVDVDMGETAQYETWEDAEGAHTYSVERWSDGVEYSRGMYISRGDIQDLGPSPDAQKPKKSERGCITTTQILTDWIIDAQKPKKSGRGCFVALVIGAVIFVAGLVLIVSLGTTGSQTNVGAALAGDSQYVLVNKESFDYSQGEDDVVVVYATSMSVDEASKDVIRKVDGKVESVKEDDDNSTVAILTANEYVLVYQDAGEDAAKEESEGATEAAATQETEKKDAETSTEKTPNTGSKNGKTIAGGTAYDASQSVLAYTAAAVTSNYASTSDQSASSETPDASVSTEGKTLVQVSTRHYAYTTDNRPYHSRYGAYRWYRAFYHGMGYAKDWQHYSDTESSYSKYNGETVTEGSSPSSYETYAKSLREESASTKKTSGGGTSGGK